MENIGERVTLCEDGKYRWRYDVSLLKNPMIFLLVWKIFFFIFLGIFVVTTIADMVQWGTKRLAGNLKIWGIVLIGMTAVVFLGYLVYAAKMGWKYCVIFEMDEKGINHAQIPEQADKARAMGEMTMRLGAGNPTMEGIGRNSQRTEMYSEFAKVKKVKAYPNKNLIKVNGVLDHNQVYVLKEDFEFVEKYIISRCHCHLSK